MLVRLNFSSVGADDSITNARAHLADFVRPLMLVLDLCILDVLTLFPLLSMLLIEAEGLRIGYSFFSFLRLFISGRRVGCLAER